MQYIVLIIWTFQYLAHLAGKRIFTYPKLWFWSYLIPKWASISTKAKNGTPLRESASFEPTSVKIWGVVWPVIEFLKKGMKNLLYFTYLPRSSHGQISAKCCTAVGVVDVITFAKIFFGRSVKGLRLCGGGVEMEGFHWLSQWLLTFCWHDCVTSYYVQ